jgi:hypothetical protein
VIDVKERLSNRLGWAVLEKAFQGSYIFSLYDVY